VLACVQSLGKWASCRKLPRLAQLQLCMLERALLARLSQHGVQLDWEESKHI
jgi:hypothetical protein